jgi:hypothetical protein
MKKVPRSHASARRAIAAAGRGLDEVDKGVAGVWSETFILTLAATVALIAFMAWMMAPR